MNNQPKHSLLKVIFLAGLLAGVLDITAACIQAYINNNNITPDRVLRYIASGIFGRKAFTGGSEMIILGLLFHFIIATGFAAIFVLLAQQLKFLSRHFVISGLVYGIIVWVIMNRVVVPLSEVRTGPFEWKKAVIAALILMFMIGLPIAWVNKHYTQRVSNR